MKPISIIFLFILLIFTEFFTSPLYAQPPDTIKQIPFVETWESGSFDTNGWSFPYMQGHWTILPDQGNPEPCAGFSGSPSTTNYIYALQSPWFDASQLTCDKIFLSFDLKLENVNPTGLERFRVELQTDSNTYTLCSYQNTTSLAWQSVILNLSSMGTKIFRLRFVVNGSYSPSITGWFLDNIQITSQHNGPRNFENYEAGGLCTFSDSTCTVSFIWEPPNCHTGSQVLEFIFDDGSPENGWRINEGYLAWLGNEFPIDPLISGVIHSVDLWWGFLAGGSPPITIDFFDDNRTLVGSSDPFTTSSDDWMTVPIDSVPFDGPFYTMVKWDLSGSANYLGFDEDGPYSSEDLEWYYDGSAWDKLSAIAGSAPGVFLIRVNATVSYDGKTGAFDSTTLVGYNIYFFDYWGDASQKKFVKRNPEPIVDTFYTDYIPCWGDYYVTALFSDSIEVSSDTLNYVGCVSGMPENRAQPDIVIKPNPAVDVIEIESSVSFSEIRLIDMLGLLRHSETFDEIKVKRVRLPAMASGSYIVTILTTTGPVNRKLILSR